MKLSILAGSTSQSINVFIQDSSSTTGAGLTGLVYNSGSLTAYYALPRAAAVAITLATLAAVTSGYSSGGFKEIDATNMPGWYRLDLPDAALASGRFVCVHLKGATNMAPLPLEIELTAWNNQDGVRGGMTALPNAAAGANGGLPLGDASGRVDVSKIAGTAQTARDLGASVLLSAGTGTGQLDIAAGVVKANVIQYGGSAGSFSGGIPAVNATQFAGQTITAAAGVTLPSTVASPTNITAGTITTVTNLTNAPTAGDFTATMKTSIGTAVAASAVASVTGSVGGNVTGSVGSVTGNVGGSVASVVGLTASNVGAIKAVIDRLDTTLEADVGGYRFTGASLAEAPTGSGASAADIAEAVWDEALSAHVGVGSAGAALAAAGSSGDPWSTPLPGAYGAGTAGKIVGDALDAAVSSRASQASLNTLDDFVDTEVAAIKARTDNLPASPAAVGDIPTPTENADALLTRDMSLVDDSDSPSVRMPLDAFRAIRNRWDTTSNPGYHTVRKENDTTEAFRAALSTDPSGQPITGSDPT